MPQRLIGPEQLDGWRGEMAAGFDRASQRQRRDVSAALRAHGLRWDSPAKDTAGELWSPSSWQAALRADLLPASQRIASQIISALRSAAPAVPLARDLSGQLAQRPIDRALAGGSLFARRLGRGLQAAGVDIEAVRQAVEEAPKRYGGVIHPESQSTVADAYQAAHDQLASLVASVTSQMSNEAVAILGQTAQERTGSLIQHQWSAVGDDRTREDHMDADGQVQDAGQAFDVGGEQLMYPGDPAGSDGNTCNCRCWLEVIGMEDLATAEDEDAQVG